MVAAECSILSIRSIEALKMWTSPGIEDRLNDSSGLAEDARQFLLNVRNAEMPLKKSLCQRGGNGG